MTVSGEQCIRFRGPMRSACTGGLSVVFIQHGIDAAQTATMSVSFGKVTR
jgi:NCAIR mutase (PurE)-related protein